MAQLADADQCNPSHRVQSPAPAAPGTLSTSAPLQLYSGAAESPGRAGIEAAI